MFTISFQFTGKNFIAKWNLLETSGQKPPVRASHSCTFIKPDFLIIIGGETTDFSNYFLIRPE